MHLSKLASWLCVAFCTRCQPHFFAWLMELTRCSSGHPKITNVFPDDMQPSFYMHSIILCWLLLIILSAVQTRLRERGILDYSPLVISTVFTGAHGSSNALTQSLPTLFSLTALTILGWALQATPKRYIWRSRDQRWLKRMKLQLLYNLFAITGPGVAGGRPAPHLLISLKFWCKSFVKPTQKPRSRAPIMHFSDSQSTCGQYY